MTYLAFLSKLQRPFSVCSGIMLVLASLTACQSTGQKNTGEPGREQVKNQLSQYLTTYALHQDFELLLDFYHPNAQLENIIKGDSAKGRAAIKKYFDWDDEKLTLKRSESAFVMEQIWIDGLHATVSGFLMPFEYDGVELGPWRTVMLFEFDRELKIIKQTDFVNYTPKILVNNSPNSNLKIKIPGYLMKNKP